MCIRDRLSKTPTGQGTAARTISGKTSHMSPGTCGSSESFGSFVRGSRAFERSWLTVVLKAI
eukprot:1725309-Karenia_brevis.AAC.1